MSPFPYQEEPILMHFIASSLVNRAIEAMKLNGGNEVCPLSEFTLSSKGGLLTV